MLTREEYIAAAKERGVPEQTINSVLAKKQFKSYSQPVESAISDKTGIFDLPVVGGLLRNVVSSGESYGRLVGGGLVQAPVLAATGGKTNIPFLNEQELQEMSASPMEGLGRTANMMGTAATLYNPAATVRTGLGAAKAPIHPIQSLGKARSFVLKGKTVPTADMEETLLKKIYESKDYTFSPNLTKNAVKKQLNNFFTNLNPMKAVAQGGPLKISKSPTTPIDEIYQAIHSLEKGGGAYKYGGEAGSTALGQGTNLISLAVREYLRGQSPTTANVLTGAMRVGYGAQKNKGLIAKAMLYALGAMLIGKVVGGVGGQLSGNQ